MPVLSTWEIESFMPLAFYIVLQLYGKGSTAVERKRKPATETRPLICKKKLSYIGIALLREKKKKSFSYLSKKQDFQA